MKEKFDYNFSGCAMQTSGSLIDIIEDTVVSGSVVNLYLFDVLGRGGNYQYYWSTSNKSPVWFVSGSPLAVPEWDTVYYNVNPSRERTDDYSRGTLENVMAVNCLYGDFDAKDGWDIEKVEGIKPSPSVIVFSGHGWHCYWLLKEPIIITEANRDHICKTQEEWVKFTGADKNAKDLTRMLRVPCSFNNKDDEQIQVAYHVVDLGQLYEIGTLEGYLTRGNTTVKQTPEQEYQTFTNDIADAFAYLQRLSPRRVDNYDEWLQVGMCLKQFGEAGLNIWDEWSKKSDKYRLGECAAKWETFTEDGGLTPSSLKHWAEIDSPYTLEKAPKNPTPEDYSIALDKMGFSFKLNECNDDVLVNGTPMNDILEATMLYELKNHGYQNDKNAAIAWKNEASKHRFHPVVDYLKGLNWDGYDHIGKLCTYIEDEQNVFQTWMKRWLIGCVAKVLANPKGQQNRMLILDGKQNIGKSYFVRWLCRPLPAFHIESPINPEDKDSSIRLMSKWIWEVSELGSTTRKADREALKQFLSLEKVTVRKSYGHFDTEKPAMANFIGTVNNEVGFLNDPTGSRRFMTCTITRMDWNYAIEIDVNQVWAQAVALFNDGEPWNLTKEEIEKSNLINKTYELENPYEQYILKHFDVDKTHFDWMMPTADIVEVLEREMSGRIDVYQSQRNVTAALRGLELEYKQKRLNGNGNPTRVWVGIRQKDGLGDKEEM